VLETSTETSLSKPDDEPSAPDDAELDEPAALDDAVLEEEPPDAEPPDAEPPDDDEPVEPPEPVSSANATAGMDAIAAPTPKATASAPTRPT